MAQEDVDLVVDEARAAMKKSLDSLARDLTRVRTGRANPAVLDGVHVEYHGTSTPLKSLASLNAPEPRLITIQPYDRSALGEIERAILKADLGLKPLSDGKILRVPIPELTEERRRDLVKQVKKMAEDHKLGVRNARRDGLSVLKDFLRDGQVSEDESKQAQKKIQTLTDEYVTRIDQTVGQKEEEILRI